MSALALPVLLGACSEEEVGAIADPSLGDVRWESRGVDVRHHIRENGITHSVLVADTAYSFGPDSMVVVGFTLTVHDEVGNVRATVVADEGKLIPDTEEMYARGAVVLTIPLEMPGQNRIVESEEMRFSPTGRGQLRSDVFTVIRDPDRIICGTGFTTDLEFASVDIQQNLRTGAEQCRR